MSHEFETGFVVREQAWHGLATVLTSCPSVAEGIVAAGLDWEVQSCPVSVLTGSGYMDAQNYRAMVRSTDQSILSVLTKAYTPLQNADAFGWFQPLLDDGSCALESAGSLKGGKFVWVLAKINGVENEVTTGDRLEAYLLLSNAHDGSRAVTVAFTPIRVVCWNTLSSAHGDADRDADKATGKAVRVYHSKDVKKNLEAVRGQIDVAQRNLSSICSLSRKMAQKAITDQDWLAFLEGVYGPERDALRKRLYALYQEFSVQEGDQAAKTKAEILTVEERLARPLKRESALKTITGLLKGGPGAEMAGQTVWGALNAITHYEEHVKGKSPENRLASSWMGGEVNTVRNRAYDIACSML